MVVALDNNPLQPGPNPVCYFVAYKVFNVETSREVMEGNQIICTSESLSQLSESILRENGRDPEEYNLVITALTVLSHDVARQLIKGCEIKE